MPSVGDVFSLVMSYDFLGQLVQNRYHYTLTAVGTATDEDASEILAARWLDQIKPTIEAIQSIAIVGTRIQVQNLNSLSGDYDLPLSPVLSAGVLGGDSVSSLLAWSFQLLPFTKAIKWGRKSIAGIAESSIDGNTPTATALASLAALAAAWNNDLTDATTGAVFYPAIARIAPASVRPFVPLAVGIVDSIFRGVGTQYSRKPGRGA